MCSCFLLLIADCCVIGGQGLWTGLLVGMTFMVVGLMSYLKCRVDWQKASEEAQMRSLPAAQSHAVVAEEVGVPAKEEKLQSIQCQGQVENVGIELETDELFKKWLQLLQRSI